VDLKQLKDIMQLFERSSLSKMVIKEKGGAEVTLEKPREVLHETHPSPIHYVPPRPPVVVAPAHPGVVVKEEVADVNEYIVKSPMVGTFYRSPSPEEKPYVNDGDKVNADTVVCIIEAMKVMNEVKAGKSGVVKKTLVSDGDPIEFNSPLFVIG